MYEMDAVNPVAHLILAHGAGADMQSDFMQDMAKRLAEQGITVSLFNFPYMVKRESDGKKRPPDRLPVLQQAFEQVIEQRDVAVPLFIGGKSMGGRVATTILQAQDKVKGGICLGYPFHPPGKPDKLRVEHLMEIRKPLLIVQGERDTFGNQQEVMTYTLSSTTTCEFIPDGDHSLKPRKKSGLSLSDNLDSAVSAITRFIKDNI